MFVFLFPFLVDHSRIRLQLGVNDYINASLITVEEAQRNYILTQVRWKRYWQSIIFVLDIILEISQEAGHCATCAVKYSFYIVFLYVRLHQPLCIHWTTVSCGSYLYLTLKLIAGCK